MKKAFILSIFLLAAFINSSCQTNSVKGKQFTETLMTDSCTFATTGRNQYFILEPGYQLVLEGMDGKDKGYLEITVLNETKKIGNVETRVVEENESVNGKTVEISRNFFAFCKETVAFIILEKKLICTKMERL